MSLLLHMVIGNINILVGLTSIIMHTYNVKIPYFDRRSHWANSVHPALKKKASDFFGDPPIPSIWLFLRHDTNIISHLSLGWPANHKHTHTLSSHLSLTLSPVLTPPLFFSTGFTTQISSHISLLPQWSRNDGFKNLI